MYSASRVWRSLHLASACARFLQLISGAMPLTTGIGWADMAFAESATAYVWGKRGVRIKTSEGEVFLGHSQPEKLVRDLDLMTHNHEEHEVGRRS